jgi:phosphoribosylglycinamide formyltransferase-1
VTTRLAVLISGRGSNMRALVEACRGGVLVGVAEIALVVADTERATGLDLAREVGVATALVPSRCRRRADFERELLDVLAQHRIERVALAGFMRVLSPLFVAAFAGRIVNIHPADTAAYQGAHGYAWAHAQGLATTWISVHLVDQGVDTGRVLGRAEVDLRGAASLDEVERRGLKVEHRLYPEVIRRWLTGEFGASDDEKGP